MNAIRLSRAVVRSVACVLLVASVPCAGIVTVGPPLSGADFDDLQAAIDAALPGDVVLVRSGVYGDILVQKPLRILGSSSGKVRIEGTSGVRIESLGRAEDFVLSGVEVRVFPLSPTEPFSMLVRGCAGTVVLHDVLVSHPLSRIGLRVEDVSRAVLLDCHIEGAGALDPFVGSVRAAVELVRSRVAIAGGSFSGEDTTLSGFVQSGAGAIDARDSSLDVARASIRGGDAADGKPMFGVLTPGGAALSALGCELVLRGGPGASLQGGDGIIAAFFGQSSPGGAGLVLAGGSSARIQASLPIAGGFDGPGTTQQSAIVADASSAATFDPRVFPTLAASPTQLGLGTSLGLSLAGPAGALELVFAAPRTGGQLALVGVEGALLLSPAAAQLVAALTLDSSGGASITLGVPASAVLLGQTAFLQTLELSDSGLALSSAALATIIR